MFLGRFDLKFDNGASALNICVSNVSHGIYGFDCTFVTLGGRVVSNWTLYVYPYIDLYLQAVEGKPYVFLLVSVITDGHTSVSLSSAHIEKTPVNATTIKNITNEVHVLYRYLIADNELTTKFVLNVKYKGNVYVRYVQVTPSNPYAAPIIALIMALACISIFYILYRTKWNTEVSYIRMTEPFPGPSA